MEAGKVADADHGRRGRFVAEGVPPTLRSQTASLPSTHPSLSREWDEVRNAPVAASQVSAGSNRKAWWRCARGHAWGAVIASRVRGNGCPVCSGRQVLAGENDLASRRPDVAAEWHPDKNYVDTTQVTAGSETKAWWRGKCGHEWKATISSRAAGNGCPVCHGLIVLAGFNDLASLRPDIAATWHPTRNAPVTPSQVTVSTIRKMWWLGDCGHPWIAPVSERSMGRGCPVCVGRQVVPGVNDLPTKNPLLAAQWHPTRNETTQPTQISEWSNRKLWWLGTCGHEWLASAATRSRGRGCPICSGKIVVAGQNDLAHLLPGLAADWHPVKNAPLRSTDVTVSKAQHVWWLGACGHEWRSRIASRSQGVGCPVCSGQTVQPGVNDLSSLHPLVAALWHPTRNGDLRPDGISAGTDRKVWWLCEAEHEWQATVGNRVLGTGCAKCALKGTSRIEQALYRAVSPWLSVPTNGSRHPLKWGTRSDSASLDIAGEFHGRAVAIEYDGHYYHSLDRNLENDKRKTLALLEAGWTVVRIRESPLEPLGMEHPKLHQTSFVNAGGTDAAMNQSIAPTAEAIHRWLKSGGVGSTQ
jgi:hypothetical protein